MSAASSARRVDWGRLVARLDRLNRVLVPKTRAEKERFERSRAARLARRVVAVTERLSPEGQALAAVVALTWVAALDVRGSHTYVAWAAVAALLGASLALSPLFALRRARLEVLSPRRVAVGEDACFSVTVHNDDARPLAAVSVRGAWFAWDRVWLRRVAAIARIEPRGRATVELVARFSSRGAHALEPVSARALVPLGLALGPRVSGAPLRVLVVPRLARVTSLALPAPRRHHPGGVPRASHAADARELGGVRPYRVGDPVRDLHARTWARVGEPVVREYREEVFSRVGIVLDTDGTRADARAFEAAVSLVAGVVARVMGGEALVDVLVVGGAVHGATLGRGLGTLDGALDLLATAEPEGPLAADALFRRVAPHLSRLSALVVVTTAWDEERRALRQRLVSAGAATVALVVGDGAGEPGVRFVERGRIERGEALAL